MARFDVLRHGHQLLFSVAQRKPQPSRLVGRRLEQRPRRRAGAGRIPGVDLFETRPPAVKPLVETGSEHLLGADDVEALETRHARKQIEVGDEQPVGIGNPVGQRHDDVSDERRQRLAHQLFAQHVLVAAARRARPRFVVPEGLGEKPRLRQQSIGAAIARRAAERLFDQLLEPLDLLRLAAQLIVEAEHLGDQSGPQPERQTAGSALASPAASSTPRRARPPARCCRARADRGVWARSAAARAGGRRARRGSAPAARHRPPGPDIGRSACGDSGVAQRPAQLLHRAARGHDDHGGRR